MESILRMNRYKYWVVECCENSKHLIPLCPANGIDGRPLFLSWPGRFLKCPQNGNTHTYGSADVRVEERARFTRVPVSKLPSFSQ